MSLGDTRRKLVALIERYRDIIKEDNRLLMEQNKKIVGLEEELKQAKHLIGLYEACINKGVKIEFPNSEGRERIADDTDTGNIDFSDF